MLGVVQRQPGTQTITGRQTHWSTVPPAAGTTPLSREATHGVLSAPLRYPNLFLVDLPPFLALGENILFCFLGRFVNPLPLEEIAGLAGGH